MLTLTGIKTSSAQFPLVPAHKLEEGKIYSTAEVRQDDDGIPSAYYDMVFYYQDLVPGNTKKIKLVRFLREHRVKRLSEVVGVSFFGPIEIDSPDIDLDPEPIKSSALENTLDRMIRQRTIKE